jgi:hypothetical protein
MKIGWIVNARMRNRSGNQCERLTAKLTKVKPEVLFIPGNFSGSGHDLFSYFEDLISGRVPQTFFSLSNQDFRSNDGTIQDMMKEAKVWAEQNKHGFSYLGSHIASMEGVAFIGGDTWFDAHKLDQKYDPFDFETVREFRGTTWQQRLTLSNEYARLMAELLASSLEDAYETKPSKVVIFTNLPGLDKSLDFGGINVVPEDTRGVYLNRYLYPTIEKLVKAHKKIKHLVIAGSPLGNNSTKVFPNLKEFVCTDTFVNEQGQKDVALHTLTI